jgi:hypothetical protein
MTRWWMMAGLFVVSLTVPANVLADEITVDAGQLFVEINHSSLHLEGMGFVLDAPGSPIPPTSPDVIPACTPAGAQSQCAPGQVVSMRTGSSGSDLGGFVTLNGDTFKIGSVSATQAASVTFDGAFTVPAFSGQRRVRVTSPFTFEGLVIPPSFPNQAVTSLVGKGTTSVDLIWTGAETGWQFQQAFYNFGATQPTPEPATLLLVAPALAGLVLRRRGDRGRPGSSN